MKCDCAPRLEGRKRGTLEAPVLLSPLVDFDIVGPIRNPQTIAVGRSIRDLPRLRRLYGRGRWRKRKGIAHVRLPDGFVCYAEVHWYEATGVGTRELKIKRLLTEST